MGRALLAEPAPRAGAEVDGDAAIRELRLKLQRDFSTTRSMISGARALNGIIASRRLRNSGVNRRLIASLSSPERCERSKPMAGLARSAAPAFVVMIKITLRKSTDLPLWSVILP